MARLVNEHVGAVVARQTEKRAGQVEGGLSLRASAGLCIAGVCI